jgi:uncharacterized membrane protein YuzA (DUF378 family)
MMKKCWCGPHKLAGVLVFIGGLNWGLVGVGMLAHSDWNLVHMIFKSAPTVEAIVYVLIGVAAIMMLFGCKCAKCKACEAGAMPAGQM